MVLWHHTVVISIAWKTKLQKWQMSTTLVIQFFEINCLWSQNSLVLQFWRKFTEKEYPSWASGGLSFHGKVVIFIWKDGIESRRKKKQGSGILPYKRSDAFWELCFLVTTANSKGQNVGLVLHFRKLFSIFPSDRRLWSYSHYVQY